MPATNSTNTLSERGFSALCRLNYTDQVRLNSCMALHVHKNELTNFLCQGLVMSLSSLTVAEYIFGPLLRIGNEFIQLNSSRVHILVLC